ncbi:glycyl-radical enzyme activating protein, partial [Chloroflexota bacterium]
VKHKEITGVSNEIILDNARKIAEKNIPIIIRVPLISGYNDSEENLRMLAEFMIESGLSRIDILPYHQLGENKYRRLDMEYKLADVKTYTESQVLAIKELLESYNLEVTIG